MAVDDDETRMSEAGDGDVTRLSATGSGSSSSSGSSAAPPKLESGQTFGPYEIGRLLGRGGMGEVWEAHHADTGRRVALKVLRGRIHGADDRARFLSEGRLAASISHPHTVYVFGSDEVAGAPVISMQLLPGGTLKDRVVERGPLPVVDAVAAILDVVSGLDAAEAAGILHRDIKPSNCFVDHDGKVKIGDFGLSISATARDAKGGLGFQGTPQYAPPEQLRGDALDVRADIYAVGATLFYLLTGRAPFDSKEFQQLVKDVKDTPAPLAHRIRPGIPSGLSAVIARCLAKDPAARPATYADLVRALRPFSGAAAPATRGIRLLAGAIDMFAVLGPLSWIRAGHAVSAASSTGGVTASVNADVVPVLAGFAYFALCEARWGATLGKRLCGLRVASTDGDLTWRQAAARSAIFQLPGALPVFAAGLIGPQRFVDAIVAHPVLTFLTGALPFLMTSALFVTMTRRNGMRALHDLWTGTRVVQRKSLELRRAAALEPAVVEAAQGSARRRLGTFEVTRALGESPEGALLEAVDVVLRRRVWILERGPSAPDVPRARRDVDRTGRLHWLASGRDATPEGGRWDAFEAPTGAPLDPTPGSASWRSAQAWLNDISAELSAAAHDGTLPALDADRVWIRSDGRAVLLDFPGPHATSSPAAARSATKIAPAAERSANQIDLLLAIGRTALGNRVGAPMPVSAVTLLDRWQKRAATLSLDDAAADLAAVNMSPDTVSRTRRLTSIALSVAPVAMMLVSAVIAMRVMGRVTSPAHLRMIELLKRSTEETDAARKRALETYLAGTLHDDLADDATWKQITKKNDAEMADLRRLAGDLSARRPSTADLAAATAFIQPTLDDVERDVRDGAGGFDRSPETIVTALLLIGAAMSLVGGLCSVLIRPSGVVLAALGLAVLTASGREIGRLRAIWRLVIAWSPLLVFSVLLAFPLTRRLMHDTGTTLVLAGLATAVVTAGVVWTVLRPTHGPHDVAAGTTIGVR